MKKLLLLHVLLFVFHGTILGTPDIERAKFKTEIEASLIKNQLTTWYPRAVDNEWGGFVSNFDRDWSVMAEQPKMLVTQSRHVWTSIRLSEQFPTDEFLLDVASHGLKFLKDKMWDTENGGFYQLVERNGIPIKSNHLGLNKTSYGNAFAIYALSAYHEVTHDKEALYLAKKTFHWLEANAHDNEHLGYFNAVDPKNQPLTEKNSKYFPKGQNTSIHLMEAFTELYRVWKDPLLKERIVELRELLSDKMIDPRGFIRLYFDFDWTHYSISELPKEKQKNQLVYDHVSFGHDVEIAYLILETYEVLEQSVDQKNGELCKRLVTHALKNGWDNKNGGLFDAGFYANNQCEIVKHSKCWWGQGEMLNSLILMDSLHPNADENYFKTALELWNFMQQHLIDQERGGWYEYSTDNTPEATEMQKAHIWKGAYHETRALLNVLRKLSSEE